MRRPATVIAGVALGLALLAAAPARPAQAPATRPPRAATAAVPSDAVAALWIDDLSEGLVPAVDALASALGPEAALGFLEQAPLPYLALEVLLTDPTGDGGLDRGGGLGIFRLPGHAAQVGFVAIREPEAARRAVLGYLLAAGAKLRDEGPLTVATLPAAEVGVLVDRGFLYMLLPDGPAGAAALGRVAEALGAPRRAGLDGDPDFRALDARVPRGGVRLFQRPASPQRLRGFLVAFRPTDAAIAVDGALASKGRFLGGSAPRPALLRDAPLEPAVLASVSADPLALAELLDALRGAPGPALPGTGFDLSFLGATGGEAAGGFWVDPTLLALDALEGGDEPGRVGGLLLEGAAPDPEALARSLAVGLAALGPVDEARTPRGTRLSTALAGDELVAHVGPGGLRIEAGPLPPPAAPGALAASLAARFGGGAFGRGHLSLLVDLGRVRRALEAPLALSGPGAEALEAARAEARAGLEGGGRLELVFLDVAPDPLGGVVRGELVLRPLPAPYVPGEDDPPAFPGRP